MHVGVLAGYDSFHDAGLVLTTIGFDVPTIVTFFLGHPFESAPSACGK